MPLSDLVSTLTFQHQPLSTLSQATPTQNQDYNILAATTYCKLIYVRCSVATTAEDLTATFIIDGQTITGAQAGAVAGTTYYVYLASAGNLIFTTSLVGASWQGPLEGRSIQVTIKKTSANGTGTITGYATYQRRS